MNPQLRRQEEKAIGTQMVLLAVSPILLTTTEVRNQKGEAADKNLKLPRMFPQIRHSRNQVESIVMTHFYGKQVQKASASS